MEVNLLRKVRIELGEHDAWKLEQILDDYASLKKSDDGFKRFAEKLEKKIQESLNKQ